jgi:hypothetical protein
MVARRQLAAGGAFGPEQILTGVPACCATSATILTDGSGGQVAVWSGGQANRLQVAVRTVTGGFGAAHTLDRHRRPFAAALNRSGRLVVAWARPSHGRAELRYAFGTSSGRWLASQRLRARGQLGPYNKRGALEVALDNRGRALLVDSEPEHNRVLFASAANRRFSPLRPMIQRPGDRRCEVESLSSAPTNGRALVLTECSHPGAGISGELFPRVATYRR